MKYTHVKSQVTTAILVFAVVIIFLGCSSNKVQLGEQIDEYKGVSVYNNGIDYAKSYGESYSSDGYYYGQKWQCVEFIKRFYFDAKGHKMLDGFGNAKDFFDPTVQQGKVNKTRGLTQYRNGEKVKPAVDDLIVFTDTTYGHVAIVSEVGSDYIEVVQQNVSTTRDRYSLSERDGNYFVGTNRKPAGWLRK